MIIDYGQGALYLTHGIIVWNAAVQGTGGDVPVIVASGSSMNRPRLSVVIRIY